MPETATLAPVVNIRTRRQTCRVAVIWIDWYAYHVARFLGLESAPSLTGRVAGIELVGGVGVHAGLKFREDMPSGLAVETLMPESSWKDAGQLRLAIKLWKHLSKLQPEVLLVPGYYTLPAIAAAVWARVYRVTSVMMTESTYDDHYRVWWKETAKSLLIRTLFDWAVAGGKAHVRYLRILDFPADRIARFYDVVDNDFFRREALGLRRQSAGHDGLPENYFLYIGRLAPEKNIDGLLHSWLAYRASGGTMPLVLVGDGPSAPALRQIANASACAADVHFAGLQGTARLPIYYAFAACFVLPSTREPWGLVVNEAMASGLPVLVSNRCGCAEDLVLSGRNGFVFDPADPAQLTRRLTQIEQAGSAQRQAMAASSLEIIQQYSPRRFGSEIACIQQS